MSNVTEFPIAARQLSEYEALVSAGPAVLDAIPGAVYICDHDGWLVRYNAEAAALWGRAPDLGNARASVSAALWHCSCRMAPRLATKIAQWAKQCALGSEPGMQKSIIERPDRSRITALVNIRALRDDQGNIQGAINCFQDVSAHKAAEAELLRKNNDLEDFFENSAVGLHIVSGEGIIVRANQAELNLLGYSAEEYVGRHIAEFHADAPVIGDILQKLSKGTKLDRYAATAACQGWLDQTRPHYLQQSLQERQVRQHPLLHHGCDQPA